jgi:hypothetical protein
VRAVLDSARVNIVSNWGEREIRWKWNGEMLGMERQHEYDKGNANENR